MLAGAVRRARCTAAPSPAVLINTPGESASVVTCLDGYQMALQGGRGRRSASPPSARSSPARWAWCCCMLVSPLLARWALSFGPPETFALMLLGLTTVTAARRRRCAQGLHQHGARADAGDGRLRHHLGRRALRLRHRRDDGRHGLPAGGDRPLRPGRGAGRRGAGCRRAQPASAAYGCATCCRASADWRAQPSWAIARGTVLGLPGRRAAGRGADRRVVPRLHAWRRRCRSTRSSSARARSKAWRRPESANNAAATAAMVPMLHARHPGLGHHRDHARRADDVGPAARADAVREEPAVRLGPDRLAVHRQRHAADRSAPRSSRCSCARCASPTAS